ncbi:hypothetical protein EOPP23_03345 [Endozoicomonas sp. OPT23]|uniref:MarR family winged helix-turn-helix transcriptional regulator n=1 Tax=Endozoicomonas sp. OPT23 TaxID=2072845 RepID=UPI00129B433B|nr:MarR family transcriptional regulator [Endozoicomonas sp. OPT23]MRI32034.1 hypothetical protein [Endozoicomonas sp. OPT23]
MTVQTLAQSFDRIERQLSRLWRVQAATQSINTDVSYNEYDYIRTVFELGSPRLSDLAAEMKIAKASATVMVQKLEKRGFLKRSPCNEDRRAIRISVTKESEQMFEADQEVFAQLITDIGSGLNKKELSDLERLLSKACGQFS